MDFISPEFLGMLGGLFRLCELIVEAICRWMEEGGKKNGRNNAVQPNPV